jgi:UDP-glucuronate 4-epimerase
MITLVTGATGFVGINIVEALLARGDEVVAFGQGSMPVTAQAAFARFGRQLTVVEGDVRDASCVDSLLTSQTRIDRLVHAAAITAGVAREKTDPTTIIEVNVAGTARVLEAARRNGVGRIVHVSSGSAYGTSLFEFPRLCEDVTPDRPETMYQITKFAGERTALRLRALHALSTHFQLARMASRSGSAVLPRREYRRDWVYCRDVAAGIVALLDAKAPSHTLYNLSSGREWGGLTAWCERLQAAYGVFEYRIATEGECSTLAIAELRDRVVMDITRMERDIGFKPRFGPNEAYDDYTRWLLENRPFAD